MRFSIIVPVYNVEKYLHRCVDSLIKQTYKNIEIILVNDGSTDSSGSICDDFKSKDSRINVIHQKNQGVAETRNSGLKIAQGEYIVFVDSDDTIELNSCEVFNDFIEVNENLDILCGGANILEKNRIYNYKFINNEKENIMSGLEFLKLQLENKNKVYHSSWIIVFRRMLLTDNELSFNKEYLVGEDEPFNTKALFYAKRVIITGFTHYNYYRRLSSLANTNSLKKINSMILMCQEFEEEINKLDDTRLKKLLYNEFLTRYIKLFAAIDRFNPNDKQIFKKVITLKHALTLFNKIKVIFFRTCPVIYKLVYKIHIKIRYIKNKNNLFE